VSTVLSLLPLLVAVVLGGALLTTIVQIWSRHQHPLRLALQSVSAATLLGVLGIVGILPDSLWWVTWTLALAILVGIAVAARRLLVRTPPTGSSPRRARLLEPPTRSSMLSEGLFWLALVVLSLLAG
jgi:hypothetical protein